MWCCFGGSNMPDGGQVSILMGLEAYTSYRSSAGMQARAEATQPPPPTPQLETGGDRRTSPRKDVLGASDHASSPLVHEVDSGQQDPGLMDHLPLMITVVSRLSGEASTCHSSLSLPLWKPVSSV